MEPTTSSRSGADAQGLITPSPAAMYAAQSAARRAKKDAPVRRSFFTREQVGDDPPPMAQLLRGGRGGRGGDVRFRLYLSLLWLVHDDAVLSFPARSWAALLDLEDPERKGARRIKDALRWLNDANLIHLEPVPGRDSLIQLRSDAGTGELYELPGAAYHRLQNDPAAAREHWYTRLPSALWSQGWMAVLSGPAVAMLLALIHECERSGTDSVWLSPSVADARYDLSEDTRGKGIRQLEQGGIVEVHRRSVATDTFDYRKVRNVYQLHRDVLNDPAQLDPTATREARRLASLLDRSDEPFGAPVNKTPRRPTPRIKRGPSLR